MTEAREKATDLVDLIVRDHREFQRMFAEHNEAEQTMKELEGRQPPHPETRPHPNAPDRPPLNLIINPGVGIIDRGCDVLSNREV